MRRRPGVFLFAAWFAISAAAMTFGVLNRGVTSDLRSLDSVDFVYVVASCLYTLVFAATGALVRARTRNPIGGLLTTFGVAWMLPILFEQYVVYGLVVAPGSVPATTVVAWLGDWTFFLMAPVITLILLLFPSGTTRSSRWRPVCWLAPVAAALFGTAQAIRPGPLVGNLPSYDVTLMNPLGVDGAAPLVGVVHTVTVPVMLSAGLAGVVCIVLRFRSSRGVERQQIKWPAIVAMAAVLIVAVQIVVDSLLPHSLHDTVDSIAWGVLVTTVLLGVPLAIGAAILRYRLFDIDRIISRTLSYTVVTALLAATYGAVALLIGTVVRGSGVVVAAATLVVAAAFRPLRDSVQRTVDRRFNRTRYDATVAAEQFASTLRDRIELSDIGAELVSATRRSVQPSRAMVWLRTRR